MPAVSKKQQKFMGMVRQCQKTGDCASDTAKKTAKNMKKKDVKDFAATNHEGLPEKMKEIASKKTRIVMKHGKKVRQVWVDGLKKWIPIPENIEEHKIMKKKFKLANLINEGGIPFGSSFSQLGGVITTKPVNDQISLSSLVQEEYHEENENFDPDTFMEAVGGYNKYRAHIFREGNLRQVAEELGKMAEDAKTHTLKETEGWFDKITVSRNMKELTNLAKNFKKEAISAQSVQERVESLYEDMGNILSRYYEIKDLEDGCDGNTGKNMKPGGKGKRTGDREGLREEGKYQEFFKAALKKFGVSSPDELDDSKKKTFYNWIDSNWSGKKETD